jgi:hypothetical protein
MGSGTQEMRVKPAMMEDAKACLAVLVQAQLVTLHDRAICTAFWGLLQCNLHQ